jgi:uncharacterized protein (DUF885 family)
VKFFVSLLLCLCLAGRVAGKNPEGSNSAPGDAAFKALAEKFIEGYLAWRPLTATAEGVHTYDGQITDFSAESVKTELARLKEFDRALAAMDIRALSPGPAYDSRILHAQIKTEIFAFEDLRTYSDNPMTYATALDVNTYIKRDFAPLEKRARFIVSILERAPEVFKAARSNLNPKLPKPHVELAIDEASGAIDFLKKDLVAALGPITNRDLKIEFEKANAAAISEFEGYVSYLQQEKLPGATEQFALGREKFARMLEYGEMVTLTPEELLDVARRELKRKQAQFLETARIIDPSKTAPEVFKAIQKDHPTEQSLIPDVTRNLDNIRRFVVERHLVEIPSAPPARVTKTPQFLRATSFASMDTPGPFEKKAREAYYYVTPVEADWPAAQKEEWLTAFNYYTTDIVSIHEAYPGHYVQFLALNASSATRIEKLFSSYAFVEGWAHYSEQMMVDEGFGAGGDPKRGAKYKLAQIDEALLRICRMCVSLQMHCQAMSVDEATKFFQDNCYYQPKPARQEALRGAYEPEYLYYTLGKLQILKLREDYKKQEGSNYSLSKFHKEMLRHGCPPIRLLREVMLKEPASWDSIL